MQAKIKVQKPGNLTKALAFTLLHEMLFKQRHTALCSTKNASFALEFSVAEVPCYENSLCHSFLTTCTVPLFIFIYCTFQNMRKQHRLGKHSFMMSQRAGKSTRGYLANTFKSTVKTFKGKIFYSSFILHDKKLGTWGVMLKISLQNNNPENLFMKCTVRKQKDMATLSSSIVKCTSPASPATAKSVIVGEEYSRM